MWVRYCTIGKGECEGGGGGERVEEMIHKMKYGRGREGMLGD